MNENKNILDLGVRTIGEPNQRLTSAEHELISAFLNMDKEAQELRRVEMLLKRG